MTSLPALKMMESAERIGLQLVGAEIGEQASHQATVVDLAYDLVVLRGFFRGLLLGVLRFPLVSHVLSPF